MSLWRIGQAVVIFWPACRIFRRIITTRRTIHDLLESDPSVSQTCRFVGGAVSIYEKLDGFYRSVALLDERGFVYDVARALAVSESERLGVGAHDGGRYDDDDSRRDFVFFTRKNSFRELRFPGLRGI
ncbi:hypothetical protein ACJ7K1_24665 [Paenibacillus elgii]